MKFKDLPEKRKEELRDKWRELNVCDDWYEDTFDYAKEEAAKFGFSLGNIYFSGFWSQGDGASFDGYLKFKECDADTLHEDVRDVYQVLAEAYGLIRIVDGDATFYIDVKQNGRYCHENTMDYSFDWTAMSEEGENILESKIEDVEEALRDYARWIYRTLEEEYEHLTSDEAIDEYLNDQDYNDQGEMQ